MGLEAYEANATWPYMASGPWGNFAYDGHVGYEWHDLRVIKNAASLGLDAKGAARPLGGWCDVHAHRPS